MNEMTCKRSRWESIVSLFLCVVLTLTLIPEVGYSEVTTEPNQMIVDKTIDSTTYDLGNGKKETIYHGSDVRYEDENGNLIDYDPSLTKVSDKETEQKEDLEGYAYENTEGDRKQYLPEVLSEETPVILENEIYHMHFSPTDETLSENNADGMSVTAQEEVRPSISPQEDEKSALTAAVYEDETSNTGITYSSLENGVKETLVFREKPESNIFTYAIDAGNLIPVKNEIDAGISFIDPETDEIVSEITPAWMNDASGEAYSEDIAYEIAAIEGSSEGLEDVSGKYILSMIIDPGYLDSPDRKYPVTVDPTISWTGKSNVKDAYVISGSKYQNTNFFSNGVKKMPAGKNKTGQHMTFISFTGLKSKLSGKSIATASLTVYEYGDGAKKQKVGAYRVTGSWNPSKITWKKKPGHTGCIATVTTRKTKHAKQTFNLTSYVKGVLKGSYTDHGIVLKNITSSPSFADFCGSRYSTAKYRPKLSVTYYNKPSKPAVSITSKSTTGNGITISYSGISTSGLKEVRYSLQKKAVATG